MEIQGRIKATYPTQNVSASFTKRDVVITTDEQYPQDILIQFTQEKCSLLDNYQIGQEVKIGINLRGREWTNPQGEVKYFNTIQGWQISGVKPQQVQQQTYQQPQQQQQYTQQTQYQQPQQNFNQQPQQQMYDNNGSAPDLLF